MKIGRGPQKEDSLPTIIFEGQAVSFRECHGMAAIVWKITKYIILPTWNKALYPIRENHSTIASPFWSFCVFFGYFRASKIPRIHVAAPTWPSWNSRQRRCKSNFNHSKLVGKLCLWLMQGAVSGREGTPNFRLHINSYTSRCNNLKIGFYD